MTAIYYSTTTPEMVSAVEAELREIELSECREPKDILALLESLKEMWLYKGLGEYNKVLQDFVHSFSTLNAFVCRAVWLRLVGDLEADLQEAGFVRLGVSRGVWALCTRAENQPPTAFDRVVFGLDVDKLREYLPKHLLPECREVVRRTSGDGE